MQPMPVMQPMPMMQPLVANEPNEPQSRGGANNNELENESGSVGPGDFGRTAFMWFAWNSLFAVIMTTGTFACYQLPSFKNDCETDTDNPGNCIEEESSEFSVVWIIPVIISVLLFGGFMKISLPIFTSKFIRRTLFKGTPSTRAINAQGKPVIKLRTTMTAWVVLLLLIAQTIALTVVASTVIDDRCRPESIERAKAEGVANTVTGFFGSFAYGAQNNWEYNLVNFVSLFNPRYWLWITLSLAIIYSMLSMTGEQAKQAKKAYKKGKEAALKAGKSASAASRQGLKAGATPMVANVAAAGHKGAQATMQKTYPQTALAAQKFATKTRGKRVLEASKKANATIKLQSAARGRAVRAPLQKARAAQKAQDQKKQEEAVLGAQKARAAKALDPKQAILKKDAVQAQGAAQTAKAQLDQKRQEEAVLRIQRAQRAKAAGKASKMAMRYQLRNLKAAARGPASAGRPLGKPPARGPASAAVRPPGKPPARGPASAAVRPIGKPPARGPASAAGRPLGKPGM